MKRIDALLASVIAEDFETAEDILMSLRWPTVLSTPEYLPGTSIPDKGILALDLWAPDGGHVTAYVYRYAEHFVVEAVGPNTNWRATNLTTMLTASLDAEWNSQEQKEAA